jgi:hypothetical protein
MALTKQQEHDLNTISVATEKAKLGTVLKRVEEFIDNIHQDKTETNFTIPEATTTAIGGVKQMKSIKSISASSAKDIEQLVKDYNNLVDSFNSLLDALKKNGEMVNK